MAKDRQTMNPSSSRMQVPATGGDWGLGFSYKTNQMSKTSYWTDPQSVYVLLVELVRRKASSGSSLSGFCMCLFIKALVSVSVNPCRQLCQYCTCLYLQGICAQSCYCLDLGTWNYSLTPSKRNPPSPKILYIFQHLSQHIQQINIPANCNAASAQHPPCCPSDS